MTLLDYAKEQNAFSRIRVTRAAPKVSYLFFADDRVIFSKPSKEDCGRAYFRACLKISRTLCKELETIMSSFGGVMKLTQERSIGLPRKKSAGLKKREE